MQIEWDLGGKGLKTFVLLVLMVDPVQLPFQQKKNYK